MWNIEAVTAGLILLCVAMGGSVALYAAYQGSQDYFEKKKKNERLIAQALRLTPFTAGRLANEDGTHRADGFGIVFAPGDLLPKPGAKIWVNNGFSFDLYTVKAVETCSQLGEKGCTRSPEVYVLIEESLSDELIVRLKSTLAPRFGTFETPAMRAQVQNLTEQK